MREALKPTGRSACRLRRQVAHGTSRRFRMARHASTTPAPPAGSGSVAVRAVTNSTGFFRVGHFTIGGVVYTVSQESTAPPPPGGACSSVTLDRTSFTPAHPKPIGRSRFPRRQPRAHGPRRAMPRGWVVKSTTPAPPAGSGSVAVRAVTEYHARVQSRTGSRLAEWCIRFPQRAMNSPTSAAPSIEPLLDSIQIDVDDRRDVERQRLRHEQPADDGQSEGPARLSAGAPARARSAAFPSAPRPSSS